MTMRQFYSELRDLLRNVPENPIIRSSAPWKRGSFLRIYFLSLMVLAVSFPCLFLLYKAMTGLNNHDDVIMGVSFIFVTVLGMPVLVPFNLLVFRPAQTSGSECLEELILTEVTPRQIAIAEVFWGIVATALVSGSCVCMLLLSDPRFGGPPDTLLVFLAAEVFLANVIISVFWRFRLRKHPWALLLISPFTSFLVAYWYGGFIGLSVVLFEPVPFYDEELITAAAILSATLGLLLTAPIAGRLAGTRMVADLFPETLEARSNFATSRDFEKRRLWPALSEKLKRELKINRGEQLAYVVLPSLVVIVFVARLPRYSNSRDEIIAGTLAILPAVHFLFSALLCRSLFKGGAGKHFRAGAIWKTIFLPSRHLTIGLLGSITVLFALGVLVDLLLPHRQTLQWTLSLLLFFETIGCGVLITPAWLAFCLSRSRPMRAIVSFSITIVVFACCASVYLLERTSWMAPFTNELWLLPMCLLGLFTPIPLLYCFQQLHEKYCMGVGVGEAASNSVSNRGQTESSLDLT